MGSQTTPFCPVPLSRCKRNGREGRRPEGPRAKKAAPAGSGGRRKVEACAEKDYFSEP